ncbi:signal peptidase I [Polaribacter vadi]|uniref:signal peptidase I n=1 Tax=Polaribacter TaxID=52959 RepID=UPI001C08F0A1|nr:MULTISPECIES: signal peptidase I [Polaribacter]MBU3012094.1 signal peptidase I [Polaribacter vadi]MDO6741910.1 signal peptidase I [Polaribacter sp. 1_MG-2023]
MNKRKINYILYFVTFLIVVYYLLNLSGILVLYNNPTPSNEPNIPQGSKSLVTNFATPKRGDFVSYNFSDQYSGKHKRVHRLIGLEGDKIEIRNGLVFVNDVNFDKNLSLVHYYKFSKNNLEKIYETTPDYAFSFITKVDSISLKTLIKDSEISKLKFKVDRLIESKNFVDAEIQSIYNKPWNKDNFGPLIVPKNKVFILGDNRDATFDSRNIGFIEKDEIVGVIIKVF